MTHNFDTEIATEYGINEAILLNNIYYWVEYNKANEKNFHDGYYWTYSSAKAFSELFPYMSLKQVTYALKKLKKEKLIITGNYNQSTYDRTTWYALTEKGYSICTKGVMHLTKGSNAFDKNVVSQNICQKRSKKTRSKKTHRDMTENRGNTGDMAVL